MLKLKQLQQVQGFTLVEVMASIVIATLFVATAMQAMVVATVFKAKAQEYSEATTWIQEDLENLRLSASQYADSARCSATGPNNGYADGLRDNLHNINPETRAGNAASAPDSDIITPTKTSRSGKTYTFRRVSTPQNAAPYAVLRLTYTVTPTSGGSSTASFYTEVIPDATFQCS